MVGVTGGLPILLIATAVIVTASSLYTGQSTEQILNRLTASVGGIRNIFLFLGVVLGISLLMHGSPADAALFEGAKKAAKDGIGTYIGTNETTNMISALTFALWAFGVVGALAVLAGGVAQNVMVLAGGLTLFFGIAIIIMVLEFSDKLIFAT
ncbi:hypothetical protein S7335_1048 [Synechococcus sp. PCC 7335]|uniref:hypothetical protein n=1 Tax=Synechococcus sp. (strain ATCC 29403 / PCC 7335) TaxID=91464 RepID=UPI00017ECF26|nr:hypothetical protein [Synechococcus sp. PCC 7335]EDX82745.1 hypothetical protein S7335_1048 [Synechococcus sp. PCC 7335]